MGREGAAAPAGLEGERGGLEGAARADSVESGGWGRKGGDGISGRKKNLCCITWALGPVGSIGRLLQRNL